MEPLLNIVVVTVKHLQLYLGVIFLKGPDDSRQPMDGDTGECTQTDGTCIRIVNIRNQGGELLLLLKNCFHLGEQEPACFRQLQTTSAAVHQGKTVLGFQIV